MATRLGWLTAGLCLLLVIAPQGLAKEFVVRNDSLDPNTFGLVQAGFDPGESAAVWLTSPCDGNIVAVQVFWRSQSGGTEVVLQDSIRILQAGTYPVPGAPKINDFPPYDPVLLEAPALYDGFLNEYRYMDEQNTVPLRVPVFQGEVFVVSFKFSEDPDPANGPSLVTDFDGCESGLSAIDAVGLGWMDACWFGLSGDFVIRAVVDCPGPTGACCHVDGTCTNGVPEDQCEEFGDVWYSGQSCEEITCTARGACCVGTSCLRLLTETQCVQSGGIYAGDGTSCTDQVCVQGACCIPSTGECILNLQVQCDGLGGVFQGPGTSCDPNPCPQPTGACCLAGGAVCVEDQFEADCAGAGGVWAGPATTCVDEDSNGVADACEAPPAGCRGDYDCNGQRDFFDIDFLLAALGGESAWVDKHVAKFGQPPTCGYLANCDANDDGSVDFFDIDAYLDLLGQDCP